MIILVYEQSEPYFKRNQSPQLAGVIRGASHMRIQHGYHFFNRDDAPRLEPAIR